MVIRIHKCISIRPLLKSFPKQQTEAIAKALYQSKFELGDSVAVYSPNDPGAVICIFGAYRAGGAWVPVNVRNAASTNAEYMAYVKTRWLFFHSSVS